MRAPEALHVALYGNIDMNALDGASIWLASLAEILARQGVRTTLLLRTSIRRELAIAPVRRLAAVNIVDPTLEGWTSHDRLDGRDAVHCLERLDERDPFDAVIVRGVATAAAACRSAYLRPRLWAYLTDFPQPGEGFSPLRLLWTRRIGRYAHRLLCQTPELADHLTGLAPRAAGRCVALPPMIPDDAIADSPREPPRPGETFRLLYAGKFAPRWNTLDMTRLPQALRDAGIEASLTMVGDKFQRPLFTGFEKTMREALATAPRVSWVPGVARREVLALTAAAHIGLSWRRADLDRTVELSTKLLEYGAAGVPPLLNPTAMHRSLLGSDYPLFAAGAGQALTALRAAACDAGLYAEAARRAWEASRDYTFSRIGPPLVAALSEAVRG